MNGARSAAIAGALCVLAVVDVAAADVKLQSELSPRQVEVGARFMMRLNVTSTGDESLSAPELKVPSGIKVSGPNLGTASSISFNVNGRRSQSVSQSVTWILTANRAGKFRIGPASIQTANGRRSDQAFVVEVVPQGSLPQVQPPGGQPADPWGMLRGPGFPGFPGFPPGFPGFSDAPELPELPTLPDEYRVEHAPDAVAFLRAVAEPRRVIVGEQVTLDAFAYGGRGDFGGAFFSEPGRDDFLTFNMTDEGGSRKYPFELDGRRWLATKIASFALFPLKAGKLKIGSMSFGFSGRGYSNAPQGLVRKSAAIEVEAVEPPLAGRPPGYRVGDVGRYTLSAQVQPRQVPVDGSISIVAKLDGTGNLPFTLLVPERDGVHFLEPQLVEDIKPKRGVVGGFRTFTYVVELTSPGELDLGELTLPYYDAKAGAYGVARAALGKVMVTGVAKPAAPGAKNGAAGPNLKSLVTPPPKLGKAPARSTEYLPSRAGYWLVLVGLPLSVVLGFALSDLAKLLRRRLSQRRGSVAAALDDALGQLASAARAGDVAASAGSAERALFLAIERATGLKARGVLKSELAGALVQARVTPEVAQQAAALLARCDELRFAGAAADLPGFAQEAREICQKLAQHKPAQAGVGAA